MILSNPQRKVLYVSNCWVGKTHDYGIFKEEFPPEQDWFKDHRVRVDLGFLGIEKDYAFKELLIPNKKKKNQELSAEQKDENKLLASERIYVEHAIGGMKRYRILSDRLRVHDIELYDVILGVCAGLWNFYLSH
ncbi:MAG: transposase family protein [bacterium]